MSSSSSNNNIGYSPKIQELLEAVGKKSSEDICRIYRETLYNETLSLIHI